jgi:hypothetical protein
MDKKIEKTYCPINGGLCYENCQLLVVVPEIAGSDGKICSLFSVMVSLDRIANVLELMRVERE